MSYPTADLTRIAISCASPATALAHLRREVGPSATGYLSAVLSGLLERDDALELLDVVWDELSVGARTWLAHHQQLSVELVERLYADEEETVATAAARHPKLPSEHRINAGPLERLQHLDWWLREDAVFRSWYARRLLDTDRSDDELDEEAVGRDRLLAVCAGLELDPSLRLPMAAAIWNRGQCTTQHLNRIHATLFQPLLEEVAAGGDPSQKERLLFFLGRQAALQTVEASIVKPPADVKYIDSHSAFNVPSAFIEELAAVPASMLAHVVATHHCDAATVERLLDGVTMTDDIAVGIASHPSLPVHLVDLAAAQLAGSARANPLLRRAVSAQAAARVIAADQHSTLDWQQSQLHPSWTAGDVLTAVENICRSTGWHRGIAAWAHGAGDSAESARDAARFFLLLHTDFGPEPKRWVGRVRGCDLGLDEPAADALLALRREWDLDIGSLIETARRVSR